MKCWTNEYRYFRFGAKNFTQFSFLIRVFSSHICSDRKYWTGLLTGIRKRDANVFNRKSKTDNENNLPYNVIIYGFDSLSKNAFIRKLPRSYLYLTKVLEADVLQGYNIVGDGTPQAIIPVSSIVVQYNKHRRKPFFMYNKLNLHFKFSATC